MRCRFLCQRTQNAIVVLRELRERNTVADVVDADTERDELRIFGDAVLQLAAQNVGGRRAANAEIGELCGATFSENPSVKTSHVAAVDRAHTRAGRIA